MRLVVLFLSCLAARGAEPDWAKWEAFALDLLQRYLRMETVSPPSNTRAAAEMLKVEFEARGFTVQLLGSGNSGQTNMLVRLPGRDRTKKPLLLLNHLDVVPVDRARWPVDPFGGIVRDGWIWGRGALDMKGIGVQQMTALMALKEAGIVPPRDIVMLSTADEEMSGIHGIRWMIANHPKEVDAEYVLDEGGIVSRDLIGAGKLVFGVAVGEKQMLWLRLRASGTAAHGSQPIPDNANNILLRAIDRALAMPESSKSHAVVEEMKRNAGRLADNKFTAAIQRNTITLTTITSGVGSPPKINVIPSVAEATLDCRLLPGVSVDEFISELRARINDSRVTVEPVATVPDPGVSAPRSPLMDAIRTAALKHYPGAIVTPILIPYGTDSVQLRARGVKAYGLLPMMLDASLVATMHSDGERIPVSEFLKGIRIFYDVLRSEF